MWSDLKTEVFNMKEAKGINQNNNNKGAISCEMEDSIMTKKDSFVQCHVPYKLQNMH